MLIDGCWPRVTNEKEANPADILAAYNHQPSLERRHHQLKGDQIVAPMFIHDPARIEGLMMCHFVALLVHALVELEARASHGRTRHEEDPALSRATCL
jgi:transposase